MTKVEDGGPAFPRPLSTDEHTERCNTSHDQTGMSLRDWFAGQALAGLCANGNLKWDDVVRRSNLLADAMLRARREGSEQQ